MIPGVILAAGQSRRMGLAKATLSLGDGDTFLSRIVRTFQDAGVDDVVVVIGHEAESVRAAAADLAPRFVVNTAHESGQLSSLLVGLNAVDRPGVTAMLLTLVDAPLVTAATIRAVIEQYRATRAPVVRPVQGGRHGHPVLIDRSLFTALRKADPESGAKTVVRAGVSSQGEVETDDEGAFDDIDTPEDYTRALERVRRGR